MTKIVFCIDGPLKGKILKCDTPELVVHKRPALSQNPWSELSIDDFPPIESVVYKTIGFATTEFGEIRILASIITDLMDLLLEEETRINTMLAEALHQWKLQQKE